METLADRAARSLGHHPAPALTLEELAEHMRSGGPAVPSAVLGRALEARPDVFRVLDPWRGPWRACAQRAANRPGADGPGHASSPGAATGARWVVLVGRSSLDRDLPARLKASLAHLGRTVDERSATDLARWLAMVREMERGARPHRPSGDEGARAGGGGASRAAVSTRSG